MRSLYSSSAHTLRHFVEYFFVSCELATLGGEDNRTCLQMGSTPEPLRLLQSIVYQYSKQASFILISQFSTNLVPTFWAKTALIS